MGQRHFLFLGLGLAALGLAACSATTQRPNAAAPYGTYKLGKPYEVDGRWYYPAQDWTYDRTGIASWYDQGFAGRFTADGETFNPNALTAAHKTLPLPTVVQVTNLENGRSIQVRINDRGPFVRGRIIDLSRRAAQLLGFEQQGTAKVRVQILVPQTIQAESLAGHHAPPQEVAMSAPATQVTAQNLPTPADVSVAPPQPVARLPQPPPSPVPAPVAVDPPQQVTQLPVTPSQIYIQAGAFESMDRAVRLKALLRRYGPVSVTNTKVNGLVFYRVRVGPVQTVPQADTLLSKVTQTSPDARIVVN